MRWVRLAVVATVVASTCVGSPLVATAVSPDSLGTAGPCKSERHRFTNPVWGAPPAYVFLPAGDAQAPVGGTCGDDSRPVVLFAHGYSAKLPEVYMGLIDHLVSLGHTVVYPAYQLPYDPARQYRQVEAGFETAVERFDRIDTSRLGIVGHSFGGGMSPWLVQWATAHGWGVDAIWLVAMMPHFSLRTGTGPIDVPDHTRAAVIAGQKDHWVDNRIGIEIFHALDIPYSQKEHVTYLDDNSFAPVLDGDHLTPLTIAWFLPANEYDSQGVWRVLDAVSFCSLRGTHCDADLSDVGTKDGRPIRRAEAGDSPRDMNWGALQECTFFINPRPCPGPSPTSGQ